MRHILAIPLAVVLISLGPGLAAASDALRGPLATGVAQVGTSQLLQLSGCDAMVEANMSSRDAVAAKRARWSFARTTVDIMGRKVLVFGRLVPSTNIAAQMGALDSTVVTMAMTDPVSMGYGPDTVPRKRVKTTAAFSPPGCATR